MPPAHRPHPVVGHGGVCAPGGALKASVPPQGSRGELLLSLCYNPSANSIVVNIIKARNLKAMDIGGTSGTTPSTHPGGGGQALSPHPAGAEHRAVPPPQTPT